MTSPAASGNTTTHHPFVFEFATRKNAIVSFAVQANSTTAKTLADIDAQNLSEKKANRKKRQAITQQLKTNELTKDFYETVHNKGQYTVKEGIVAICKNTDKITKTSAQRWHRLGYRLRQWFGLFTFLDASQIAPKNNPGEIKETATIIVTKNNASFQISHSLDGQSIRYLEITSDTLPDNLEALVKNEQSQLKPNQTLSIKASAKHIPELLTKGYKLRLPKNSISPSSKDLEDVVEITKELLKMQQTLKNRKSDIPEIIENAQSKELSHLELIAVLYYLIKDKDNLTKILNLVNSQEELLSQFIPKLKQYSLPIKTMPELLEPARIILKKLYDAADKHKINLKPTILSDNSNQLTGEEKLIKDLFSDNEFVDNFIALLPLFHQLDKSAVDIDRDSKKLRWLKRTPWFLVEFFKKDNELRQKLNLKDRLALLTDQEPRIRSLLVETPEQWFKTQAINLGPLVDQSAINTLATQLNNPDTLTLDHLTKAFNLPVSFDIPNAAPSGTSKE